MERPLALSEEITPAGVCVAQPAKPALSAKKGVSRRLTGVGNGNCRSAPQPPSDAFAPAVRVAAKPSRFASLAPRQAAAQLLRSLFPPLAALPCSPHRGSQVAGSKFIGYGTHYQTLSLRGAEGDMAISGNSDPLICRLVRKDGSLRLPRLL